MSNLESSLEKPGYRLASINQVFENKEQLVNIDKSTHLALFIRNSFKHQSNYVLIITIHAEKSPHYYSSTRIIV